VRRRVIYLDKLVRLLKSKGYRAVSKRLNVRLVSKRLNVRLVSKRLNVRLVSKRLNVRLVSKRLRAAGSFSNATFKNGDRTL